MTYSGASAGMVRLTPCVRQWLAPAARTTHAIGVACLSRAQLVQPAADRAARKTRDPRHRGYAARSAACASAAAKRRRARSS